jgi:hypothetical protein
MMVIWTFITLNENIKAKITIKRLTTILLLTVSRIECPIETTTNATSTIIKSHKTGFILSLFNTVCMCIYNITILP